MVWAALAQVGPQEDELVHLLGGHLLPPLHGQALLAHSQALAADGHGRHGQQPERQAGQPGKLVAHRRAPVLEEVGAALQQRLSQVLKDLLPDLALAVVTPAATGGGRHLAGGRGGSAPGAAAVVPAPVYAAHFRGRWPIGVPLVYARAD